jgi:hypothetical protein
MGRQVWSSGFQPDQAGALPACPIFRVVVQILLVKGRFGDLAHVHGPVLR